MDSIPCESEPSCSFEPKIDNFKPDKPVYTIDLNNEPHHSKDEQIVIVNNYPNNEPLTYFYIQKNEENEGSCEVISSDVPIDTSANSTMQIICNNQEPTNLNNYNGMVMVDQTCQKTAAPVIILSIPQSPIYTNFEANTITISNQNNQDDDLSMNTLLLSNVKKDKFSSVFGDLSQIHDLENLNLEKIIESLDSATIEEKIAIRNLLLPRPKRRKPSTSQSYLRCLICNAKFNYEMSRLHHIHKNINDFVWNCGFCGDIIKNKVNLLNHENECSGKSHPLQCQDCNLSFAKSMLLDDHIRMSHDSSHPYKCSFCLKPFHRIHDLKRHLNLHFGIKNNICSTCGKQFGHPSNLISHQRTHTGIRPYVCNSCGRRFLQTASLQKHKLTHMTKKEHICFCSEVFNSALELKKHIKMIHKKNLNSVHDDDLDSKNTKIKPRLYYCRVCGERFRKKADVFTHEVKTHTESILNCNFCKKTFEKIDELKIHSCKLSDFNPKSPKSDKCKSVKLESCNNCLMTFDNAIDLNTHNCSSTTNLCDFKDLSSNRNPHSKSGLETTENNYFYFSKQDVCIPDKNDENLIMYVNSLGEDLSCIVRKSTKSFEETTNKVITVNDTDFQINLPPYQAETNVLTNPEDNIVSLVKNEPNEASLDEHYALLNMKVEDLGETSKNIDVKRNKQNASLVDGTTAFIKGKKKNSIKSESIEPKCDGPILTYKTKNNLKCRYCNKVFHKRWNLLQHEGTHDSSLHQYFCKICGKSYAYRSTLSKHMASHNLFEVLHVCDICNKVSL